MDENVIFNKDQNNKEQQNPPVTENSQTQQDTSSAPVSPIAEQPPVSSDPVQQAQETTQSEDTSVLQEGATPPASPPPVGGGIFKKIIIGVIALVILIFIVFLFLPKGKSNKKVKLVWWGLWEDQSVMQPLIDDFHRANPNIAVEYVKQDPTQYREKLLTRIKNGTGPDIFRFHNTWVPMISDSLLPLSSDVITPSDFKKSFYPVMQKDLIQNGGIYGIPLGTDSLGLYVNTDLLSSAGVSPPQTWDDFVKAAKTLTVKSDGKIKTAGAAMGTYGNITHAPDIISLLFIQQGVDMNKFPTLAKDESDALDFYTSFAKGDQSVWDTTLDESILSFARGNLAMYIGYSWDFFRIQAISPNLHFKIYPVPQLVGRSADVASYWVEGVSAKSTNQKEALLFMRYLSKKETAQKFYTTVSKTRAFGEPYARVDLANSLKDNKIVYPFVQQLGSASSSYFASDTNDGDGGINSTSNTYLQNTINSIINDNSSSQTVVDTLDQGITQVFNKYGIH